MAQAPRRNPAKTSSQKSQNPSGDQNPKSGDEWKPETVEPGAPEPVMDDAEPDQKPDQGSDGADVPDDAENASDDSTVPSPGGNQDDASQQGSENPVVHGLNPISKEEQERNLHPELGAEDLKPRDGVVVEDPSAFDLEGETTRDGSIIPSTSYYREVLPMGSKRPTYVLMFRKGIRIPKDKVEAMKKSAEAKKAKSKDSDKDDSGESEEDKKD